MSKVFFQFHDPYYFALLIILPVIYLVYRHAYGLIKIRFSSVKLFSGVDRSIKEKFQFVVPFLRVLALALLIAALARPQIGNQTTEVLSEGVDILLTIDTSGSMKALDFHLRDSEANRLDVVKKVVDDFIYRRKYDRIGMVVFGDQAYTQCPLTLDYNILRSFLRWIRIGIVGDGTAIGNALGTSIKRLKDQKTKSKIIILLTDGRNNSGEISPITAAEIAKEYGIKIYTIGVGSQGPVPYPEKTPFGVRKVYAQLDLDEETLKEIASITGGQYFRATDTDELDEIYQQIDQLEKTEVKIKEYNEFYELFMWFILGGIIVLGSEIILSRTVFQRIP